MLTLGKFPAQVHCNSLWQNVHFSSKPHISISNLQAFPGKLRSGFCLNALKTQKKVAFSYTEMEDPDDFDDGFLDIEDGGEFDGDEDEVIIPIKNMKKWVENRPRGFGEGKVYDTSIEDKLVEELENSRLAQLANVNNLKNNPVKPKPKKDTSLLDKDIQDGFRVRLVNLPKKKNIHRDLQLAFKDVPGLLNIIPVNSGNQKTRDPVCKGLAFVDFKFKDQADRFVQNFSGQNISFGKVLKKITCEPVDPKLPKPATNQSVHRTIPTPQKTLHVLNDHLDTSTDTGTDTSLFDSQEESPLSENDDAEEVEETSSSLEFNPVGEPEAEKESVFCPSSSLNQERKSKPQKKKVAESKKSKDKIPKLNIPGSSKKLKIRDKALLADVFSKYGSNVAAALTVEGRGK